MKSAQVTRDAITRDLLERGINCGVYIAEDGDSVQIMPDTVYDYHRVSELGNLSIKFDGPPVWIKVPTGAS